MLKKGEYLKRKNDEDEIKYFAYFHIARIIWNNIRKTSSEAEIVKNIESTKTEKMEICYGKAVKLLKEILDEYNKKEKIFSIGHLFSRLEIENDINKKINK